LRRGSTPGLGSTKINRTMEGEMGGSRGLPGPTPGVRLLRGHRPVRATPPKTTARVAVEVNGREPGNTVDQPAQAAAHLNDEDDPPLVCPVWTTSAHGEPTLVVAVTATSSPPRLSRLRAGTVVPAVHAGAMRDELPEFAA